MPERVPLLSLRRDKHVRQRRIHPLHQWQGGDRILAATRAKAQAQRTRHGPVRSARFSDASRTLAEPRQARAAARVPPTASVAGWHKGTDPCAREPARLLRRGDASSSRRPERSNGYADSEHTEMSSIFHGEMSKNAEVICDSLHTEGNTPRYKDREDEAARARSEPPAPRESACPNVGQTNCRRHMKISDQGGSQEAQQEPPTDQQPVQEQAEQEPEEQADTPTRHRELPRTCKLPMAMR